MTRQALFVTASGTEVGKTLVTAALAHQLRTKGATVRVLKPVASGFGDPDPLASDTAILLEAAGLPFNSENIDACTPWRFPDPISPDMAAARAGTEIPFDGLTDHCRTAMAEDGTTLIEGIGGTMVPLDSAHTVRDLIRALSVPAVVVSGSYLGALSHALTAVQSLTAVGVTVAGVVVSESAESPVPVAESVSCLGRFLPDIPVLTVPRLGGARPWEEAPDLTPLLA